MTTPIWQRALAATAAAVAALAVTTAGTGIASADDAQVQVTGTDSADAVQGDYIVVMRPGAQANANRLAAVAEARRNGAQVHATCPGPSAGRRTAWPRQSASSVCGS